MTELREDWHDWRYDGRGYYLVNDPEITFQDDAEADAYCDEHNRALVGQAAIRERERIVAWLRRHKAGIAPIRVVETLTISKTQSLLIDAIEAGEHLK